MTVTVVVKIPVPARATLCSVSQDYLRISDIGAESVCWIAMVSSLPGRLAQKRLAAQRGSESLHLPSIRLYPSRPLVAMMRTIAIAQ
jgi:hypothetical protein